MMLALGRALLRMATTTSLVFGMSRTAFKFPVERDCPRGPIRVGAWRFRLTTEPAWH